MQDLEGILVLSLEQAVAAPLCTARLADAGARVIKVERAGGDFARHYDQAVLDQSAYFVWLNRGKESLVADIKNPEDSGTACRQSRPRPTFSSRIWHREPPAEPGSGPTPSAPAIPA